MTRLADTATDASVLGLAECHWRLVLVLSGCAAQLDGVGDRIAASDCRKWAAQHSAALTGLLAEGSTWSREDVSVRVPENVVVDLIGPACRDSVARLLSAALELEQCLEGDVAGVLSTLPHERAAGVLVAVHRDLARVPERIAAVRRRAVRARRLTRLGDGCSGDQVRSGPGRRS